MNYQIEIQFLGQYDVNGNVLTDPLVIARTASDDFISTVTVDCYFRNTTYSVVAPIGYFNYQTSWNNNDVTTLINEFMLENKI